MVRFEIVSKGNAPKSVEKLYPGLGRCLLVNLLEGHTLRQRDAPAILEFGSSSHGLPAQGLNLDADYTELGLHGKADPAGHVPLHPAGADAQGGEFLA